MFNPPITDLHGAYADGVHALLAVVADPAAHKARLDELIAQEKATDEKIASLNEMAANTRRLNTAAEAATIVLNNRKTALDTREAELDEKAKNLDLGSAASLKKREAAVLARERAGTLEAERLAAMRTDLETKHARIRDLSANL
jgi:hypothetical protein